LVAGSTVGASAIESLAAELGDPSLSIRLTGGFGNVASAAPSQAMWELSRLVVGNDALSGEFAAGMAGLDRRLRKSAEPSAREFVARFDEFLLEFGSRSTDEWAPMPNTWVTTPTVPLGMIDRLRLQHDSKNPRLQSAVIRDAREALTKRIRADLAGDEAALARIDAVLQSVAVYFRRGSSRSRMRYGYSRRRECRSSYWAGGVWTEVC
jgi:hypothetical protein